MRDDGGDIRRCSARNPVHSTMMHALHPAQNGPTVEDASWCVHRDA